MKLTQGTGRGTCWWIKTSCRGVKFLNDGADDTAPLVFKSFNNVHWGAYSYVLYFEEVLIILFLYAFIKFIFICVLVELIWPTHFFNRRHTSGYSFRRFRQYTELLSKVVVKNRKYRVFQRGIVKIIYNRIKTRPVKPKPLPP